MLLWRPLMLLWLSPPATIEASPTLPALGERLFVRRGSSVRHTGTPPLVMLCGKAATAGVTVNMVV